MFSEELAKYDWEETTRQIQHKRPADVETALGKNDLRRCKSGIIYTLNQLANEGHVYAEEEQLVKV